MLTDVLTGTAPTKRTKISEHHGVTVYLQGNNDGCMGHKPLEICSHLSLSSSSSASLRPHPLSLSLSLQNPETLYFHTWTKHPIIAPGIWLPESHTWESSQWVILCWWKRGDTREPSTWLPPLLQWATQRCGSSADPSREVLIAQCTRSWATAMSPACAAHHITAPRPSRLTSLLSCLPTLWLAPLTHCQHFSAASVSAFWRTRGCGDDPVLWHRFFYVCFRHEFCVFSPELTCTMHTIYFRTTSFGFCSLGLKYGWKVLKVL